MFRNASFYLLALLAIVIAGFWPSYFSLPLGDTRLGLHVHGISMLLWLLLLIVQPWLIRTRRHAWHRFLGKVSFLVMPVLVISGMVLVLEDFAHNWPDPFAAEALGMYFAEWIWLLMLSGFYGLAIYHRKNVQLHARYMLSTALPLVLPGAFRVYLMVTGAEEFEPAMFATMLYASVIPLALIASDRMRGKIYPPFIYLAIAWFVSVAGFKFIVHAEWWHGFADWSLRLYS